MRKETHADYRERIRETMQAFSDEALAFQDIRIVGGIDREECDREIARRLDQGGSDVRDSETR